MSQERFYFIRTHSMGGILEYELHRTITTDPMPGICLGSVKEPLILR